MIKQVLKIIAIIVFGAILLWGTINIIISYEWTPKMKQTDNYLEYQVYVEKDSHILYIYNHGHFEPLLYGGQPITMSEEEFNELSD